MADSKKREDQAYQSEKAKVDLTAHPLVTRLNQEGDPPPDLVVLIGFIGPSKKPDATRLYLDLSFNTFIEIPVAGIVSTQTVDAEDENSPTRVWVRGDAKLDVVKTVSQTMAASYLGGSIARENLKNSTPTERYMNRAVPPTGLAMNTHLCESIFICGEPGGGGGGGGGFGTLVGSLCPACYPSWPACRSDECPISMNNVFCRSHPAVCPD